MLKVAIAQIAPVFLNRQATIEKVVDWIGRAHRAGCGLVCFGESLIPAYPLWLSRTDGAKFESPDQKILHAKYLEQAVDPSAGDLEPICQAAKHAQLTVVVGMAERAADRGGHTLFCSRVVIDPTGTIASIHRKLMPTYEERLAWGIGDGAGLVTHRVGEFTLGSLNCWENWMPLARAALYASGQDLHVALWPGDSRLTCDITRFIAQEGRSFVISACALIRERDIPADVPLRDRMVQPGEIIYNGGSCIADPTGQWIIEPLTDQEELLIADLDIDQVRQERQNFDPAGHYSRPDVLRLTVDRRRQAAAEFIDR